MTASRLTALEQALLWLIAATCLAFALLTPPFQAPDEPQHFSRSVRLAEGNVLAERSGGRIGGTIPRAFADLSIIAFPREAFGVPIRYRPADLSRAAAPRPGKDRVFIEFANVANYAPTLYVPQALGVAAGGAAGLSPLASFYVARIVNTLAFLALLWGAVRILPFGRTILLCIAALPTVAYQGASVSPDATINGLGWLAIALSLAAGNAAAPALRRGWLVAVAVPLGLSKGLYAPLLLAGARGRAMPWCVAGTVVSAAAFVGWTMAAGGDQAVYVVESRTTGALVTTAPLSEQLRVVLGDPLRYLGVLGSSMTERSPVYALQLVGRFGWNTILLPLFTYALGAAMIAAGVLAARGVPRAVGQRTWWFVLGVGVVVLVETALYLTGTPLGADYVQGTQGRYFLPALPLMLLALAPGVPKRWAERVLLTSACMLNLVAVAAVVDSFWLHGFTASRGLPPFDHDAGGIVRMLLLPSPRW